MDGFCWDVSPVGTNTTSSSSSSWGYHQEMEPSLMPENFPGGQFSPKTGRNPVDFFDLIQTAQRFVPSPVTVPESNTLKGIMGPISNWHMSQHYQATLRLAADSTAANPPTSGSPGSLSLENGLMAEYSNTITNQQPRIVTPVDGFKPGLTNHNSSLESLDCLLSGTNSHTDTSVDENEEGISAIFSDYGGLWDLEDTDAKRAINEDRSTTETQSFLSAENRPNNSSSSKRNREEETTQSFNLVSNPHPHYYNPSTSNNITFQPTAKSPPKPKQARVNTRPSSSNINFSPSSATPETGDEPDSEAIAQMKEMIYRAAAFRPVNFGHEAVEKPKRKNIKISTDPQTVAARQRRERISERIRVLQKLVPGGSKMDTASMLDEAASYLKFLRAQIKALEALGPRVDALTLPAGTNIAFSPCFAVQMQSPPKP